MAENVEDKKINLLDLENQKKKKLMKWYRVKMSFEEAKYRFIKSLEATENLILSSPTNNNYKKRYFYISTALTQLENGLRASESLYAIIKYIQTNQRAFKIVAFKSGIERNVIIPSRINTSLLKDAYLTLDFEIKQRIEEIKKKLKEKPDLLNKRYYRELNFYLNKGENELYLRLLANKYKVYLKNNFAINTHSLRYIFISYLLNKGLSDTQIARILGHSKIETTYSYAQATEIENLYKKIFSDIDS